MMREPIPHPLALLSGDLRILDKAKAPIFIISDTEVDYLYNISHSILQCI